MYGDVQHRLLCVGSYRGSSAVYRGGSVPVLITGLEKRTPSWSWRGCVRQSGSSKAVDQGNLEASRRFIHGVWRDLCSCSCLDQYPQRGTRSNTMYVRWGGSTHRSSIYLILPFSIHLCLASLFYLSPSRLFPFIAAQIYTRPKRTYVSN